jgi:hypothetical protein
MGMVWPREKGLDKLASVGKTKKTYIRQANMDRS